MSIDHRAFVFDYDDFPENLTDDIERRQIDQAVILAHVIAQHLSGNTGLTSNEPIWEDFGAVLPVVGAKGKTDVFISFCPRESSDSSWALECRQRKSFLGRLFSRHDDEGAVGPVIEAIAAMVDESPSQFRNAQRFNSNEL